MRLTNEMRGDFADKIHWQLQPTFPTVMELL